MAFLPLLAGALYAIGAVATRAWCEGESTMVMTAGFFGMLAVMGGIGVMILPGAEVAGPEGFVSRTWGPLDGALWFWIAVQAVGSLIGIGFLVRGYQLGEAGHVALEGCDERSDADHGEDVEDVRADDVADGDAGVVREGGVEADRKFRRTRADGDDGGADGESVRSDGGVYETS